MARSAFAVVLGLAACGGSSTSTALATPTAPASVLELGEITIADGAQPVFKLHVDGTSEMGVRKGRLEITPGQTASSDSLPLSWDPGPTLHADGTIDAKGKTAVARLNQDGTITATETHETLPMTVIGSRLTITVGGATKAVLDLAPDGSIKATPAPGKFDLHVQGASSPGQIKAALVLLGIALAPGKKVESTPAVIESVPAMAPAP